MIALPAALLLWQPHLQVAPTQDTHEHELDLVDMVSFLSIRVDFDINLTKVRICDETWIERSSYSI